MPTYPISKPARPSRRAYGMLAFTVGVAILAMSSGCTRPLPEEGSPAERLYVEKCGTYCHRPYQPASMKMKMWETMVARMEIEMIRRGMPFSGRDRATILDYLSRNAGTM
jgi:hypothetical protein